MDVAETRERLMIMDVVSCSFLLVMAGGSADIPTHGPFPSRMECFWLLRMGTFVYSMPHRLFVSIDRSFPLFISIAEPKKGW